MKIIIDVNFFHESFLMDVNIKWESILTKICQIFNQKSNLFSLKKTLKKCSSQRSKFQSNAWCGERKGDYRLLGSLEWPLSFPLENIWVHCRSFQRNYHLLGWYWRVSGSEPYFFIKMTSWSPRTLASSTLATF